MKNTFKLSICQLDVSSDKKRNIDRALDSLSNAAGSGASMAVLPEMFNCPYDSSLFREYAEEIPGGETINAVSAAARKYGMYIAAGSIPELHEDKIYNSLILFDPQGEVIATHRKMHLFDIDMEDGISFSESASLTAGDQVTVVNTKLCTIGLAICYDMRFPELFRLMSLSGARLVIIPAAFSNVTGPAHWEILVRTRAVDNQVYVAAASQALNNDADYKAYGHSMIADPWGRVITQAGEGTEIISGEIDLDMVEKIRKQFPILKHLRKDIYELRRTEKELQGEFRGETIHGS